MAKKKIEKVEPMFSKEQLLGSNKYKDYKDALSVILAENEVYTIKQVGELLDSFMKG